MYCTRYVRVAREMGEFSPFRTFADPSSVFKQPQTARHFAGSRLSNFKKPNFARFQLKISRKLLQRKKFNWANKLRAGSFLATEVFSFGNKLTPFAKGGMFHKLRRISSLPLRRTMRGMRPFFFGLAAKPRTYLERNIAIYMPPFSSDGRCSENVQPPTHHIAKKNTKDPSTSRPQSTIFADPCTTLSPQKYANISLSCCVVKYISKYLGEFRLILASPNAHFSLLHSFPAQKL